MDGMTLNAERIGVWRRGIASRQRLAGEATEQGGVPAGLLPYATPGMLSPASIHPGEAPSASADPDASRNAGGQS
jgi:hypothetical protein